jgi:hypothetical protein
MEMVRGGPHILTAAGDGVGLLPSVEFDRAGTKSGKLADVGMIDKQIDKATYDLRRGKTGIERFGDTPALVWNLLHKYVKAAKCKPGD